ncbi:MAG: vWA domain-containing protein, partial [Alphaproteobacteria bacterium]
MTIFGFTFGLAFLWAIPFILAPILAFLALQARRQRLDVSSLLLFRDLPRRTTFQNLSMTHKWHRWLYALMFAILALIALGLSALLPAPKRLIVVDTSASMNADAGGGETRFDKAVDAANREIDRAMAAGASVAVLSLTNLGDDVP